MLFLPLHRLGAKTRPSPVLGRDVCVIWTARHRGPGGLSRPIGRAASPGCKFAWVKAPAIDFPTPSDGFRFLSCQEPNTIWFSAAAFRTDDVKIFAIREYGRQWMPCPRENHLAENCAHRKGWRRGWIFAFEAAGVLAHTKGKKGTSRRAGAFSAYRLPAAYAAHAAWAGAMACKATPKALPHNG